VPFNGLTNRVDDLREIALRFAWRGTNRAAIVETGLRDINDLAKKRSLRSQICRDCERKPSRSETALPKSKQVETVRYGEKSHPGRSSEMDRAAHTTTT
jgi:hypothetical protein